MVAAGHVGTTSVCSRECSRSRSRACSSIVRRRCCVNLVVVVAVVASSLQATPRCVLVCVPCNFQRQRGDYQRGSSEGETTILHKLASFSCNKLADKACEHHIARGFARR